MSSRRKFVTQSVLATTALLAARPFKSIAGISSSLDNLSGYKNHLVFLHTAEKNLAAQDSTLSYINSIRRNAANTILINTGQTTPETFSYDVIDAADNQQEYTILKKGDLKTAILSVKEGSNLQQVDELAAQLKKEKNCQLVVCLSQLGYRQKNNQDDLTLAATSEHIDMIISGHPTNFLDKTITAANRKRQEVLIQSSKGNKMACGKIEIGFSSNGTKNLVYVATKLAKEQKSVAA